MEDINVIALTSTLRQFDLQSREWLTTDGVGTLYGITPTRLEGLRKAREISYTRVGNSYLYNHADLRAYFERNKRLSRAQMESRVSAYEVKRKGSVTRSMSSNR